MAHEPTQQVEQRRPGALLQISLFLTIWPLLQALLTLPVVLGPLRAALDRMIVVERDGDSSFTLSLNLEPLLAALSPGGQAAIWLSAAGLLATIGAVVLVRFLAAGPRLLDLGLRPQPGWLSQLALGLAIGPVVFLAILLIEALAGWADVGAGSISAGAFGAAFVTFAFVAFSEEILARGFLLQVLERRYGAIGAAIGSSAIFSLLHIFNPGMGPSALIGLFAAGLLFAYAYLATRQLWLPIALHLSWNLSEGPIFGFPVSGLQGQGLLAVDVSGPPLITGGAFGPEAGLVGLIGIGLAAGIIVVWQRAARRTGDAGAPDRMAKDALRPDAEVRAR
jgi:membrane protease YdiL (CAAX protease family)